MKKKRSLYFINFDVLLFDSVIKYIEILSLYFDLAIGLLLMQYKCSE
jgi:hypothetical protein